jgi:hypothetical protein
VHGKTIIPGYIDIHAHMWPTWGVHKTQVYEYLANLAYGVTTTRDPQTSTTDVLTYGDLVETGELIGPRIFTTGPGVFWTDEVSSQADAREVLTRYSDFYQTHTLKQYMVGDRMQRQWTLIAAKEQGITPTLEGGLDFRKNMTEAIDGYAGSEHAYAIMPLYKDIVQLVASSGITYTPTLLVEYGGPWAENYWYEHYDVHNDAKLRRFTPHDEVDRRALRRPDGSRTASTASPTSPPKPRKSSPPAAASDWAATGNCRAWATTSSSGRSRAAACRCTTCSALVRSSVRRRSASTRTWDPWRSGSWPTCKSSIRTRSTTSRTRTPFSTS